MLSTILFIVTIIDNIHFIDFELETLLFMEHLQNDQFLQCLTTTSHAGHSLDRKCNAFNPHFDESQKIGDTAVRISRTFTVQSCTTYIILYNIRENGRYHIQQQQQQQQQQCTARWK